MRKKKATQDEMLSAILEKQNKFPQTLLPGWLRQKCGLGTRVLGNCNNQTHGCFGPNVNSMSSRGDEGGFAANSPHGPYGGHYGGSGGEGSVVMPSHNSYQNYNAQQRPLPPAIQRGGCFSNSSKYGPWVATTEVQPGDRSSAPHHD